MVMLGPKIREVGLDCGQGYHFPGDLGKALGPPFDHDVAFLIDGHDVPGVVGLVFRACQLTWFVGEQVGFHYVGTPDDQFAAMVDSRNFLNGILDPRQQSADGARFVVHGRVGGQGGGGFGGAVTLEDANPVFLGPEFSRFLLQLFGSGKDVADGIKVVGVGKAGISGEKGIRAEHDGRIGIVDKLRNDSVVERGRVEKVRIPERRGSKVPPVSPNEWKMGRALKTMSVGPKSTREAN